MSNELDERELAQHRDILDQLNATAMELQALDDRTDEVVEPRHENDPRTGNIPARRNPGQHKEIENNGHSA